MEGNRVEPIPIFNNGTKKSRYVEMPKIPYLNM